MMFGSEEHILIFLSILRAFMRRDASLRSLKYLDPPAHRVLLLAYHGEAHSKLWREAKDTVLFFRTWPRSLGAVVFVSNRHDPK